MKKIIFIYALLVTSIVCAQNWGEQILTQPNPSQSNVFGYSVAIDNDYAVISSAGENNGTGSVHVYKRDANGTWNYLQKLEAFEGKAIDEAFGYAITMQEDFLFVSSPNDRLNEINFTTPAGSVFIYKKNVNGNFEPLQRIRASDAAHSDAFGSALDMDGDFLVVGAQYEDDDENGLNSISSAGSAYIFKRDINDNWSQVQKIVPSSRTNRAYFGSNIALHGNYFIAGVRGSVFVFKKDAGLNTWSEIQILQPTGPSEEFGVRDLDIQHNYIAIGADNVNIFDSGNWYNGYVYIFKKNDLNDNWSQNQIVRLPNTSRFGQGISMDSDYLLISDPEKSVSNNGVNVLNVGKSHLFKREGQFGDQYELRETIVASQVQASSFIGTGMISNNEFANYATAIADNHFILGSPNFDVDNGGGAILSAGAAFISSNFINNNVLAEDIFWTGNISNDWNDPLNWFPNTVPQSTNDVILENVANTPNIANGQNHTINNLTTFENLTIETNASLTIQGNIDQRALITVNSAVDSNGSLIVSGNQTNPNPSNTTYNRYVSGNGNAWHLMTSPISNVDIDNFAANELLTNGQGNNRGLSWYNNVNQTWEYYQAGAVGSGNFPNGKGYAINTSANTTLEFTGIVNTSILENYPITVNGNGWNLVGNPFTAFLHANSNANATNFLGSNVNQLDPVAANIYIWNPTIESYETIGNGDEAKYVAPGQGFFIKSKAGGGNINITKTIQTHRGENLFLKSSPTQKIVLETTSDEKISRTTIAFKEGMTNDLDVSYDAAVFSGIDANFSIYTQLLENYENTKFATQFLPKLNNETVIIPLGILLNQEKELTIKLHESNIDNSYKIYLEDRVLNTFKELTIEESYTFNHNTQWNGLGRFYVHVQNSALGIGTEIIKSFQAYKVDHNTLKVNGVENGIANMYDITGKQIITNFKINHINQTINLPKITTGVYILQITENNGGKLTKKIIF